MHADQRICAPNAAKVSISTYNRNHGHHQQIMASQTSDHPPSSSYLLTCQKSLHTLGTPQLLSGQPVFSGKWAILWRLLLNAGLTVAIAI